MRNKKLAIIGASYLQLPLIRKAKEMGIETHVFAWASGDVGESEADHFYPISIIEKDEILDVCRSIGIDAICSIASDLASITVNYVANAMGLVGNSPDCTFVSTNKHAMRNRFEEYNIPSPKSVEAGDDFIIDDSFTFPVIVKPVDRSGSRGITKVLKLEDLNDAIKNAKEQSFSKNVLVEEFVEGHEFSCESISWKGQHKIITFTRKFTTGAPHFIETGHYEPAFVFDEAALADKISPIIIKALDSLGIEYGASHSEFKINDKGEIKLIEIGARMGGDMIGSTLVKLSTGVDFVEQVINVALGVEPVVNSCFDNAAAIRYIFDQNDVDMYNRIKVENPEYMVESDRIELPDRIITDSSTREGYFIICGSDKAKVLEYMS